MKPEQQRIAIAEACGWTRISIPLCGARWASPKSRKSPYYYGALNDCSPLPDYLNDLNAMHEAVNSLSGGAYAVWAFAIEEICGVPVCYNATAAQRAEAFLKTLNLWTP